MTLTWTELRSSALVGTERRALRADALTGIAERLPSDLRPEMRALYAAALLGAARRAGVPPGQTDVEAPAQPVPPAPDRWASPAATHLLELLLGNNLGRASEAAPLVQHWFAECARADRTVPDTLLVRVLSHGTASPEHRSAIISCLGDRGRWLAGQRTTWEWAVGFSEADEADLTPEALAQLGKDARLEALRTLRSIDPPRSRLLLEGVMDQVDPSTRADLLRCLSVGLGPDDETLLESALDSRAKAVRAAALDLLERLPTSARASRLQAVLAPLVMSSGKLRRSLAVERPDLPVGDLVRDLPPPTGGRTAETQWMLALVAGVGLRWWEQIIGETPSKIVSRRLDPVDELIIGWTRAAIWARDADWARALLPHSSAPGLWQLVGDDATTQRLAAERFAATSNSVARAQLVHALPAPWSAEMATSLLDAARRSKKAAELVLDIQSSAAALPDEALTHLEPWLHQTDREKDELLHRRLRTLVKYLSTRSSITEAFA